MKAIQQFLAQHGQLLLPTFLAIDDALVQACNGGPEVPWKDKKWPSPLPKRYSPHHIARSIAFPQDDAELELMEELQAARLVMASMSRARQAETDAKRAELWNFEAAKARGEVAECECCFAEAPLNRLVHCDGEHVHLFCVDCARRNAETQVGLSKYELECMSTEGCSAGFSLSERQKFLDDNLVSALDKIEQEAVLRMAGIEGLASCPFCPFAAEYPPVEVNKELSCLNPDCGIVSCRLCNAETHIPKTCEEAALERGIDLRREVEEAMTAALIRKCNKCGTPFIKEAGCNKMTCSRKGCKNIQCYVCSKSCDYSHFNDRNRGGQNGNCPLFDVVEDRHENEIKAAEEAAIQEVLKRHPGLSAEHLKFNMSDVVAEDDKQRKAKDPYVNQHELIMNGAPVDDPGFARAQVHLLARARERGLRMARRQLAAQELLREPIPGPIQQPQEIPAPQLGVPFPIIQQRVPVVPVALEERQRNQQEEEQPSPRRGVIGRLREAAERLPGFQRRPHQPPREDLVDIIRYAGFPQPEEAARQAHALRRALRRHRVVDNAEWLGRLRAMDIGNDQGEDVVRPPPMVANAFGINNPAIYNYPPVGRQIQVQAQQIVQEPQNQDAAAMDPVVGNAEFQFEGFGRQMQFGARYGFLGQGPPQPNV
ncbi:hypothetical protein ACJZ2D_006077 [Fusarium nematophilum]